MSRQRYRNLWQLRPGARGYADSAYHGYGRDYLNLDVPYKKPKGRNLTQEKDYNRGLDSFRVGVVHRIGRAKRFRIVSERFRNPRELHHTKTSIVAGLMNLQAKFAPC